MSKTDKYEYRVTESSVDKRHWIITSDVKLSKDAITDIYLIAGFDNEGVRVQYCSEFNIITKYCGTEYGDDTQVTIEGDFE
jgi:hypothetical protein|tara:strand:- start:747 stop:989 length:243 start_codon:yes stop_codon:yes gene_type:complete